MKIVGLDMSTHCGWALISDEAGLLGHGLYETSDKPLNSLVEDYFYMARASSISYQVAGLVMQVQPDYIYIEQTNKGRARGSQKQLEFIHFAVLYELKKNNWHHKVRYIDTSDWRKILNIKMTKDDSKHNKRVKSGEIRGKITPKHLAVRWANEMYKQKLKLKDNDIADAMAVATCGILKEKTKLGYNINQRELIKALSD